MSKKTIRVEVSDYIDLEDTAINLIASLRELVERHGPTVLIRREIQRWDTDQSTVIYIDRLETDAECEKREVAEAENEARRKTFELKQLAALQAKYKEQQ